MCTEHGRRGIPDPGVALVRDRVQRLIHSAGDKPIVLSAPSGYGKTVAAAHFASSFEGDVIWNSMQGGAIIQARLFPGSGPTAPVESTMLDSIEHLRDFLNQRNGSEMLVVIDDLADPTGDQLRRVLTIAQSVRGLGLRVLITTHQAGSAGRLLREALVVGPEQLILTAEEGLSLAKSADPYRRSEAEVSALIAACGGHPALYAVMLQTDAVDCTDGLGGLSYWVNHLVDEHIAPDCLAGLYAAALLGNGTLAELEAMGVRHGRRAVHSASEVLPLIRLDRFGPNAEFRVHDLAGQVLCRRFANMKPEYAAPMVEVALRILTERQQWRRALAVCSEHAEETIQISWLCDHGSACVAHLLSKDVSRVIRRLPMQQVMARPRLLLLWSESSSACGDTSGALSRAKAAYVLLSQEEDNSSRLLAGAALIEAARDQGRIEEALSVARALLPSCGSGSGAPGIDLLRAYAATLLISGDYDEAMNVIDLGLQVIPTSAAAAAARSRLQSLESIRRVVSDGDYAGAASILSKAVRSCDLTPLMRAVFRGNLGVVLVELGRLRRAEPLLKKAADLRDMSLAPYFRTPLGALRLAEGQHEPGIRLAAEGVRLAIEIGDESEVAASRVYEAVLLRSIEGYEESLISAERAYEQLAQADYMNFRRLATLEVAASLLALGDVSAARSWAEPVVADGFGKNQHHAFRAAMILAECDRREGLLPVAIARLQPFAAHVASENSNWQSAMYVRAFPELLGMFAEAFGVRLLPSHMLRMVLPQYAERSLRLSREFMEPDKWQELGLRLLGEPQFNQMLERNGEPICHVRMFGTLEVSVDGRVVQERDWRKRKARLLFAMLAVRRGADTPRDELLEHLWPDMDEDRAKNNFYVAWSSMKSALMGGSQRSAPSPYIVSARGRCRIAPEAVRLDLDDFDEALAAARDAESAGKPRAAIGAFERLSTTYRGDLLPGDVYDDWFAPQRDHYRMQFISAMSRATELLLDEDDPCEALLYARRGLSVDPLREDLYQLALRCHILAGQRSAAIDTFMQCRTSLGEELGLDPSGETMKLYQEVLGMEECPRADTYGLS